ncbi:hypothetical protein A3L23_01252 [Rhodococcoides fascians D188]|nr:hypothetical protein A3L23_01252 [Rhodococcus fascians D188]
MSITAVGISASVLLAASALGFMAIWRIGKSLERQVNFRSALLLMYIVVNNISGTVHLMGLSKTRGFVDLTSSPGGDYGAGAFGAVVLASLGTVVLSAVLLTGLRAHNIQNDRSNHRLDRKETRIALVLALMLIPPSVPAVISIQQYVATTAATRVVALDGGLARISFLAQWLTWGIGFLAIYLISRTSSTMILRRAGILSCAVALTVLSLNWTGGRSIVVIMSMPLLVAILPTLGKLRKWTVLIFVVGAIAYIASITSTRLEGFRTRDSADIWAFFDWQWGRFSILGFANQYVEQNGLLYGETIYYGLYYVPYGVLKLIGLGDVLPLPRSSMEVMGGEIFGDPSVTYLLPGFTAEYYMNFGSVGMLSALAVLGMLVARLDDLFRRQTSMLRRFCFAYLGTVAVFCTIPAQSGALPSYLFFTGLPVLAVLFLTRPRTGDNLESNRAENPRRNVLNPKAKVEHGAMRR